MRPSLRQLEYLVAVEETRHFRRAADACYVTQPALSTQLRQLEKHLGVQLFERDRRRVLPTAAGAEAARRAREILASVDALVHTARGGERPLTGPLHVGVIPTVAPYLLPRVLPAVRRAFPELRLFLHEAQTARLVERLADGRLELLILALPVEGLDAATRALVEDPFHLAVPREHRLAARKRAKESDLEGEEILLLDDGHCLRDQALSVCQMAGAREHTEFRASSLGTLVQMVASGIGVTLVPEMAVASELRGSEISVVPFAGRPPARTIGLAWRRTSPRSEEFELLAEVFERRLREVEERRAKAKR